MAFIGVFFLSVVTTVVLTGCKPANPWLHSPFVGEKFNVLAWQQGTETARALMLADLFEKYPLHSGQIQKDVIWALLGASTAQYRQADTTLNNPAWDTLTSNDPAYLLELGEQKTRYILAFPTKKNMVRGAVLYCGSITPPGSDQLNQIVYCP